MNCVDVWGTPKLPLKTSVINKLLWLHAFEMCHNFIGYAEGVCIDGESVRNTASGWHKTSIGDVQVGDFVGLAIFIQNAGGWIVSKSAAARH